MTRRSLIAALALVAAVSASCTASYPTEPTAAHPIGLYIAFAAAKGRLQPAPGSVQNSYTFVAYTLNSDGAFELVTSRALWSSSDDRIVQAVAGFTVGGAKIFQANAPGSAAVIARFEGLEATTPVLVIGSEAALRTPRIDLAWSGPTAVGSVSKAVATLRRATGSPQDITNTATWTSADPAIAVVDERGAIKAVGIGTTIITASFDGLNDWFWFSTQPAS